jgi:Cu2+-exporting ATPase
MTCCTPGIEAAAEAVASPELDDENLMLAARDLGDGVRQLELNVPDIHCAACIKAIETGLGELPMVTNARVNMSSKRVRVKFRTGDGQRPSDLVRAINKRGYRAFLPDIDAESENDKTLTTLTRALAVAGFAAGNIMLFSVSIWSGAEPVTRDLFHWISALIAFPAIAYAGQPFFRSAWSVLKNGHTNMDVPISIAILTAPLMSLYETLNHGPHAYYDAAVSLLFFLLIGRTLDHLMREKARGAVRNLARMAPRGATRIMDDGTREFVAVGEIRPGMQLELKPGERVPVDAEVQCGASAIDMALVTGESIPQAVEPGASLLAGATNLTAPLTVVATEPASDSFLARMISLMDAAENARSGYKRIADRAASLYAPVVHVLAALTLIGWVLYSGDWHLSLTNAIAVLIITCPCALALAVPIVHIVAAGRLFENGILMRDGTALERMASITGAAFDKTGTLTRGTPRLVSQPLGGENEWRIAAALAQSSNHPFSKTLATGIAPAHLPDLTLAEIPGDGIKATSGGHEYRLGRAEFAGADLSAEDDGQSMVWLSRDGTPIAGFAFADTARPEAQSVIATLKSAGLSTRLLSGDRKGPVLALAKQLDLSDARFGLTPAGKMQLLNDAAENGEHLLMVGDGINDAPALRAAHVSMAPSSASDVGRNAADFVFTRDNLQAVPQTLTIARKAAALVKQNFGLAIIYNMVAIPLAITGHVTPLIAALAMSSSSILVTLNALRLRLGTRPKTQETEPATHPVPAE